MPSARPKFFWPAKIKFWLAKNNLAGQKHQNPIQKWRSKKFWLAKFFFWLAKNIFGRSDGIGIWWISNALSLFSQQVVMILNKCVQKQIFIIKSIWYVYYIWLRHLNALSVFSQQAEMILNKCFQKANFYHKVNMICMYYIW